MQLSVQFPLTLTLSPEERESATPACAHSLNGGPLPVRRIWLPLLGAKHCPHLFMAIYHYLLVPQLLMYSMVGCLNQMRPPFVPHPLNLPTGPATNLRAPNCPINVSTNGCA